MGSIPTRFRQVRRCVLVDGNFVDLALGALLAAIDGLVRRSQARGVATGEWRDGEEGGMGVSRLATVVCAGLTLAVMGDAVAKRIVHVTAHCPEGTALKVDADGQKDLCTAEVVVSCPPGAALTTDSKGEEDVCLTTEGGKEKAEKPTCPGKYQRKVRLGGDTCERTTWPECRKGYGLRVKAGEDDCVY